MRSSVGRRHFAQFDEELQDSDQTLSTPATRLGPRPRLPTVRDSSGERRCFPPSAYFSDTTDDDSSWPHPAPSSRSRLSMSVYSRPTVVERGGDSFYMSAGPQVSSKRGGDGRKQEPTTVQRLHVDAIQFPVTRSVLWDRRPLSAAPIGISLGQVLPRFVISADALKQVYKLFQDWTATRKNRAVLCYLRGDREPPHSKAVRLEGVTLKKQDARTGSWCVPVIAVAGKSRQILSQDCYTSTIASVQKSYRDEYADNVSSKLQPKLLVFRSSPHEAQLDFHFECAASPVLFKFQLVRNLPLLMTPLAASLSRREFSARANILRSGYLTLDRTRKAVPLLKVDPLVLQQPIVGVWVYGVQIDDAWDEETARRQLADPFLYFACIGYLMSEVIKERVSPSRNSFLVALYPSSNPDTGSVASSLPRFFECSFSDYLSPPVTPLPMELYAHQQSCLVGVSNFSTDVEFTLCAAPTNEWEAAKQQAKVPTARSMDIRAPDLSEIQLSVDENEVIENTSQDAPSGPGSDEESEAMTTGWTIMADSDSQQTVKGPTKRDQMSADHEDKPDDQKNSDEGESPPVDKPESSFSKDKPSNAVSAQGSCDDRPLHMSEEEARRHRQEHSDDSSYRSCCRTQQLLTIQHQQILENQQRQLHEMQEQIAQLRHLLEVAKSENNKSEANHEDYMSDASSSSIGKVADVSGTFSRHGHSRISSQSSRESASSQQIGDQAPTPAVSVKGSSVHAQQKDTGEDDRDFSMSSLELSSISDRSVDEAISSMSSSLVSERLKQLGVSPIKGNPVDGEAGGRVDSLSISQLSVTSSTALQENVDAQTDIAHQAKDSNEHGEKPDDVDIKTIEMNKSASGDGLSHSLIDKAKTVPVANRINISCVGGDSDRDAGSDADISGDEHSVIERLLSPDAYLRKVGGFVDHHGGCFTAPPLDFHSFCVPRIKFATESPCLFSDSEDEEIRLIEQKYKRLMAA